MADTIATVSRHGKGIGEADHAGPEGISNGHCKEAKTYEELGYDLFIASETAATRNISPRTATCPQGF